MTKWPVQKITTTQKHVQHNDATGIYYYIFVFSDVLNRAVPNQGSLDCILLKLFNTIFPTNGLLAEFKI